MEKLLHVHFTKKDIPDICLIIVSALLYSCGMNTFVKSGNLFPGGFAGISRLLSMVLEDYLQIRLSFSVIYFTLNIITTLFVWRRIGHKFILYSAAWFTLTSVFTSMIHLPPITQDALLIAIFGGLVNGFAVGMSLRANASSGGTDFIAIDISQHLHRPSWNYIFALNAAVLISAGYLYGWNRALYSIIFQYASKEVVSGLHQRYKVSRLHIVTDKPDEICEAVFHIIRHGITVVPCEGAYSHQNHTLLMMSLNNDQLKLVESCVLKVDPKAFMSVNPVERIIGNYYQKPIE